ncbi:MAG: SPFH domain-containing protein [Planctomycetota bacterium]|nr:SPFH domain-containing protein [Planctomycetota bacterium]
MKEIPLRVRSGWLVLPVWLALLPIGFGMIISSGVSDHPSVGRIVLGVCFLLLFLIMPWGFFVVGPNESKAILFFGNYRGTVKLNGFHYVNPFSQKKRVSLRLRTFETGSSQGVDIRDPTTGRVIQRGQPTRGVSIKVNDLDGNPVEIAAVVAWRVIDTAQALFGVDDYEQFVGIQSESALRNLASQYHYDGSDDPSVVSLRGNTDVIGEKLKDELHKRLEAAGVEVLEARISSLAYAPEIAAAMLRRQQAGAVIAARTRIVEGAVGMVEMALALLEKKQIVKMDEEKRATIVGNLLVVLCSDHDAQPVINTSAK